MIDLIVVCGPPGVGKTTFCSKLKEFMIIKNDNVNVNIISFDDYEISKNEWNGSTFGIGRQKALNKVKTLLQKHNNNVNNVNNVIIVDDIMHLKSMRREVYTITRDYSNNASFLIVSLKENMTLETAFSRNASRPKEKQVPDSTIERLFNQFEFPGKVIVSSNSTSKLKTFPWEKVVVSVDYSSEESTEASLESVMEHLPAARQQTHYLRDLHRSILDSKKSLARNGSDNNTSNTSNKNNMSIMHMIDIAIRTEISRLMQLLPKEERKSMASSFATAKQYTLQQAKSSINSNSNFNYNDREVGLEDVVNECLIAEWLEFFCDSLA